MPVETDEDSASAIAYIHIDYKNPKKNNTLEEFAVNQLSLPGSANSSIEYLKKNNTKLKQTPPPPPSPPIRTYISGSPSTSLSSTSSLYAIRSPSPLRTHRSPYSIDETSKFITELVEIHKTPFDFNFDIDDTLPSSNERLDNSQYTQNPSHSLISSLTKSKIHDIRSPIIV